MLRSALPADARQPSDGASDRSDAALSAQADAPVSPRAPPFSPDSKLAPQLFSITHPSPSSLTAVSAAQPPREDAPRAAVALAESKEADDENWVRAFHKWRARKCRLTVRQRPRRTAGARRRRRAKLGIGPVGCERLADVLVRGEREPRRRALLRLVHHRGRLARLICLMVPIFIFYCHVLCTYLHSVLFFRPRPGPDAPCRRAPFNIGWLVTSLGPAGGNQFYTRINAVAGRIKNKKRVKGRAGNACPTHKVHGCASCAWVGRCTGGRRAGDDDDDDDDGADCFAAHSLLAVSVARASLGAIVL